MKLSLLIVFASIFLIGENYVWAKDEKNSEYAKMQQYLHQLPFKGYCFPFSEMTAHQYPLNKPYALSWRNDDQINGIAAVEPATQNQIGQLNQTYEEALFDLEGRLLEYASFYDDWCIRETSELIGANYDIIRVRYNRAGIPVEYEAIYKKPCQTYSCVDNFQRCSLSEVCQNERKGR